MNKYLFLYFITLVFVTFYNEVFSQSDHIKELREKGKNARKERKDNPPDHKYRPEPKDNDKDGVFNIDDKCPHTPEGIEVTPFGCPYDHDKDGLYDYEDECPQTPGPESNKGCPYGDKDNDGLKDNKDECPEKPGPEKNNGCPIPDNDNDGLNNNKDECPETPGPESNNGCPELKEKEKEALKKAFDNLLFETDKAVIKPSSYSSLNELSEVLKDNKKAKLLLEGHTDHVGSKKHNLQLSKERAKAVKEYLVKKGIKASRIKTKGYGESKPVATNKTEKGRQKNRRVEMKIQYD